MTPTAHSDAASSHRPALRSDNRLLNEAVQAVNDHRREIEMRRMAILAGQQERTADWRVPVPHTRLAALEALAQEATALRRMLEQGPLITVSFSALAPHTLRTVPPSLVHALGHVDHTGDTAAGVSALQDSPLMMLFSTADVPRLQRALRDDDAATLHVRLQRIDGQPVHCHVHLAAADADPASGWRWACIVPQPDAELEAPRRLPPQAHQRPRLEAWPTPA